MTASGGFPNVAFRARSRCPSHRHCNSGWCLAHRRATAAPVCAAGEPDLAV